MKTAAASAAGRNNIAGYRPAYWIFILLGVGVLLPWNTFISAPDYFNMLYGPNILFYFSMAYSYPNLIGLVAMVKYGAKLSFRALTIPSFTLYTVVLVVVPLLYYIVGSGMAGMVLTITAVFFVGLANAVCQAGVFGFAGFLPSEFTQGAMSGNGIAGVLVCVIRIITKLSMPNDDSGIRDSTLVFFMIGAFVIVLTIASIFVLMKLPYVKENAELRNESVGLLSSSASASAGVQSPDGEDDEEEKISMVRREGNADQEKLRSQGGPNQVTIRSVFRKIWKFAVMVWFVFFVTLAVFPGVTVQIPSNNGLSDWLPILLITLFNVGDTVGRSSPGWFILFSEKTMPFAVAARAIFIPLFVFCVKPRLISNDAFPIVVMAVMSFTNGYLGSLCMMFAPEKVNQHEREKAGTIMTFFLLLGITTGSTVGLGLIYAINA